MQVGAYSQKNAEKQLQNAKDAGFNDAFMRVVALTKCAFKAKVFRRLRTATQELFEKSSWTSKTFKHNSTSKKWGVTSLDKRVKESVHANKLLYLMKLRVRPVLCGHAPFRTDKKSTVKVLIFKFRCDIIKTIEGLLWLLVLVYY